MRDSEQLRFERQRQLIQQQQHQELLHQQRLLQQRHDDALAQLQRDQEVTSALKAAALECSRRLEEEGTDLAARKARFDRRIEEVGVGGELCFRLAPGLAGCTPVPAGAGSELGSIS